MCQFGQVAADEAAVGVEVLRLDEGVFQTACRCFPTAGAAEGGVVVGEGVGEKAFCRRSGHIGQGGGEGGAQQAQARVQPAAAHERAHGGVDKRHARFAALPATQGFAAGAVGGGCFGRRRARQDFAQAAVFPRPQAV